MAWQRTTAHQHMAALKVRALMSVVVVVVVAPWNLVPGSFLYAGCERHSTTGLIRFIEAYHIVPLHKGSTGCFLERASGVDSSQRLLAAVISDAIGPTPRSHQSRHDRHLCPPISVADGITRRSRTIASAYARKKVYRSSCILTFGPVSIRSCGPCFVPPSIRTNRSDGRFDRIRDFHKEEDFLFMSCHLVA